MTKISQSLLVIQEYADAFRRKVQEFRSADSFDMADLQDAYARLSRLRDRYRKEKPNLKPSECRALSKVFEDDAFFKDMMDLRTIGEHVTKRDKLVFCTTNNGRIPLNPEVSAAVAFAATVVFLPGADGNRHCLNHLKLLNEAQHRIDRAIQRAGF